MRKLTSILLYVVAVCLTNTSCGQPAEKVERRELASPYATSHVFPFSIASLKDTVVSMFGGIQQDENPHLKKVFYYFIESSDEPVRVHQTTFTADTAKNLTYSFVKRYFSIPGTENDVYLHSNGSTWYSPLYYAKGKPLKYRTPFILKLKSIDKSHTQLSVVAANPVVLNGTACCSPHGLYSLEEKVPPTTIEEHALLLYIAEKLGDITVEPLSIPVR